MTGLPTEIDDGRYARASHEVMALVQGGTSIAGACYRAAFKYDLGTMLYGRLCLEAEAEIPNLIAKDQLKIARDKYRENTEDRRHLPLKTKWDETREKTL